MEYSPAPGQFINSSPWGTPSSAQSLVGGINGALSLGAFGGYVVFRFEEFVENHPDNPFGVDFTIFGNPLPSWSEPGVVFVMEDENQNGKADDTWYELAGSDYYFSSSHRAYKVTYFNPDEPFAADVPWEDQEGKSGNIVANSVHLQPYFPSRDSFPGARDDALTLSGSLLEGAVDVDHPPLLVSAQRAFGYADNQPRGSAPFTVPDNPYTPGLENSGGDAFDISWAVDSTGSHKHLERIHFVKVQSGILHQGGYLGEVSTEITGAVDVVPLPEMTGNTSMLVIRDLPAEMDTSSIVLEAFLFHEGKPQEDVTFRWNSSEEWAVVDESNRLWIHGTGDLTLTLTVDEEPHLVASVSTFIAEDGTSTGHDPQQCLQPSIYPNPAGDVIYLDGVDGVRLTFFDISGKVVKQLGEYRSGLGIATGDLMAGVYLVQAGEGSSQIWLRFLKQ